MILKVQVWKTNVNTYSEIIVIQRVGGMPYRSRHLALRLHGGQRRTVPIESAENV